MHIFYQLLGKSLRALYKFIACSSQLSLVHKMAKSSVLILKVFMVSLFLGWISIWLLKPTELWTRKWRVAEDSARTTVFGYNGLDFAVYTFPVIALTMIGFVYLEFITKEPRSRQGRSPMTALSNPIAVNSCIGVLSAIEILSVSFFILFLAWTFYARVSNDFKKMKPLLISRWQFKFSRMATRCGLLAEACLALLLLPVLRGMSVFRLLGIQFEASIRYHIWLGTTMIFLATLHGAGTFFIWGIKHRIQDEMWKWQKTGRIYLAGEIALVAGLVIWITSLPQVRRRRFEIFYYTHHLYIVFIVFFLFHTGDRHFYMVFPGIFLFALEKLLRIIQSRPEACILSARVFSSKSIELILPKDPRLKYTPTSIIFVKIPSISKLQWHSFSIASSSSVDDDTMSVIIKCDGWWTNSLYDIINAEPTSNSVHDQQRCIPVTIEGPYGPASMNFLRYDSLLLIAGGIGVTPFLSILQEIYSAQSRGRKNFPSTIQLIYTVKKCNNIDILNSIMPLLLDKNAEKLHLNLKIFVTQESKSSATVRELISEFSQVQTVNFDTKCSSYSVHGLENSLSMAAIVGLSSILFLVCLCSFSHIFLPHAKKPSKEKGPSSETDLLLMCSFTLSITCSTFVAVILRQKRLRKQLPSLPSKNKVETQKVSSFQSNEEHEIHFGSRPNFQDIFSKFPAETGGSYIGVLVCGPETMKESVASLCRLSSQGSMRGGQRMKPYFNFHPLNFAL